MQLYVVFFLICAQSATLTRFKLYQRQYSIGRVGKVLGYIYMGAV